MDLRSKVMTAVKEVEKAGVEPSPAHIQKIVWLSMFTEERITYYHYATLTGVHSEDVQLIFKEADRDNLFTEDKRVRDVCCFLGYSFIGNKKYLKELTDVHFLYLLHFQQDKILKEAKRWFGYGEGMTLAYLKTAQIIDCYPCRCPLTEEVLLLPSRVEDKTGQKAELLLTADYPRLILQLNGSSVRFATPGELMRYLQEKKFI